RSTIQFRMLNRSKGAAMWSPRAQCDKNKFSLLWRAQLESMENVYIWQDEAISLIITDGVVCGVVTRLGITFESKAVILTNGTFLNGKIHVGRATTVGGRSGDMASIGISDQLKSIGFSVGRMKTGTPARIDGKTIDFSKMSIQDGDEEPSKFSYLNEIEPVKKQLPCYTVFTSKVVHDSLRVGFADSPLFNGTIKGVGPRYCPSIEDKLRTFASKEEHQLFLEPEGFDTNEYYLNGFSSSLPWNIQFSALSKIEGFENTHFFRPGYAIEYDYFPPTQLYHTLETKALKGLYFAGQINGTTGYEEAAAQGMMAAINAHLKINGKEELVLLRDQAYIGVLIDDLVTKGVDEPYRMFTSRAEHRILLRGDNADLRLTALSHAIGLADQNRFDQLQKKIES
ncbi:MAG: tRNA uridine-5-carboxymethylaminomethyl(34) synthesis enzyme MnmG, partial [Rikenellaceae bacterium]